VSTAAIIPFPANRRTGFILRQASRAAELSDDSSERYIAHQVKLQRDSMLRRGVPVDLVELESACLERAIRNALRSKLAEGRPA